MPNQITAAGIETATQAELLAQLTAALQTIYGSDINLDSDTPDGQFLNIFIQAILDVEDLITQAFNSFNPDTAIGNVLAQRVAINGIQPQAGTFSQTNVTITTSQSVNLYGQDQAAQPIYTVSDNAGNEWQLVTTQLGMSVGANVLLFQASLPGASLTVPNSITVPVSIVLGVLTINNPTTQTLVGLNAETDAALRIRRQQSVSFASQGYPASVKAAVGNVAGVTSAFVYENNSGSTDSNGVPSHSIWVIVAGAPTDANVAQAIYSKRSLGCGMFGAKQYLITQVDGTLFPINWDQVSTVNLFIRFTATSLDGITPPNLSLIRAQLPLIYVPGVNQEVDVTGLGTAVQRIDPNTLVTNAGFSTAIGGPYTDTLKPGTLSKQFLVTSPNILITPMILSPSTTTVIATQTQQFNGLGGYGTLTYSMASSPSGGSIDSSSGLYTAGSTANVTDVARVTDSLGNTATASVVVV